MPVPRKIFDVAYYPVHKNEEAICLHCGNKIRKNVLAYAKSSPNSTKIICRPCIMIFSDQYQHETYGKLPFPKNTPLYIGLNGHPCTDKLNAVKPQTAIFRKETRAAHVPVFHCLKCGRYFMETSEYNKHSSILSDYLLYHTRTNKPFPRENKEAKAPATSSRKKKSHTKSSRKDSKYPDHVIWSYKHPYQGGGCSGK